MSQNINIENIIKSRFDDLFLDVKQAQENLLSEGKPELSILELEQSKTSRSLLRVEKQAIRDKDLNSKSELNFLNTITEQVNQEVEQRLLESLKDIDYVYSKTVSLDDIIPKLLDIVGVKAASISKIEPLATDISWFYNDLIKMVNQPKYRRLDSKGRVIMVDSLRGGLGFFGIENLIIITSCLTFKRSLPQITDPYPQIKHRIWEEALATAISCKKIAAIVGVNQDHAFCLGMMQLLGKIVITKLYFRLFDNVQRQALIESQDLQQHEQHSALTKIQPSGTFLNQLNNKYALDISATLIDRMALKRVFIANAMHEITDNVPTSQLSPLALVLKQGKAYAQYRMLKGYKLIDIEQSKDFIRTLNMPKGSLQALKTTDMRALNLSIDDI
jgi:hypothetical protein